MLSCHAIKIPIFLNASNHVRKNYHVATNVRINVGKTVPRHVMKKFNILVGPVGIRLSCGVLPDLTIARTRVKQFCFANTNALERVGNVSEEDFTKHAQKNVGGF